MSTTTTSETQPLCTHIKTNGNICQAVAMAGERYCYFHLRDRQRYSNIRRAHNMRIERIKKGITPSQILPLDARNSDKVFDLPSAHLFGMLELPLLEDANAIQIAVTNVFRALALQQVDRRSAAVLLYSLQIVSGNLKNVRPQPVAEEPITTNEPHPMGIFAAGLLQEDEEEAKTEVVTDRQAGDLGEVIEAECSPTHFYCPAEDEGREVGSPPIDFAAR